MIRRILLPLLMLPFLCGASLPPVGQSLTGTVDLLGKPMPLPPGEWQVAASGFGQTGDQEPGPYGAIGGVLLVRPNSDAGEFLLLHTNVLPVRAGWGQPPECSTEEHALFRSVGETRNLHNACSFVVAVRRGQLLRSRLPGLGAPDDAMRLAVALPSWALVTGFRVSDRRDMLDVRYGVSPRRPDPTAWFATEPPTDLAHRTAVKELGAWAQLARGPALAALRDPAEQVPALPALALGEAGGAAPQEQITATRLSLYKLATYRVPSTLFGLAVSTIAVGDIYFGAWISFWQMATHSAVFVANELAWEWPSTIPVVPLVGTPVGAPSGAARRVAAPAERDAPVQLAANSPLLPEGAVPIRNVFTSNGKQVPLPAGRWSVLGSETDAGTAGEVLGQIEDGALRGIVIIHSNVEKTPAILGPPAECGRSDVLFAVTGYDTPEDGFCAYAKRVMPMAPDERAVRDNRLWAGVAQKLAQAGIGVPPQLLMVGTRTRTQRNFLDARYYFVPIADVERATAVLQDWSELVQEPLELGVRGRLGGDARALPLPWDGRAVWEDTVAQSHGKLQDLAAAGVITPDVLDRHRAAAEAAMEEREQQRVSLWGRSFMKVASYRVLAFIDGVAVQAFFTGSPMQGVAVSTAHAVFKPFLAYGNELYWASSGQGKAPATLLSVNFPEIGVDK